MQSGWMKNDELNNVELVEIIDPFGRSCTYDSVDDVKLAVTNEGKTLKVYLQYNILNSVVCDI